MLSGLVLSGGRGSRIGGEKALVQLGNRHMIEYVTDVLSSICDEIVVSVAKGNRGTYSEILKGDLTFVEDRRRGVGPLEGLVEGLGEVHGDYVLVSPCDTPFLKRTVCEEIVKAAAGKDGAVPRTGEDYLEPLHGAYRVRSAKEAFRRALSRGDRAPVAAFPGLDLSFVSIETILNLDPELMSFWNINSPEDLRRAESQLARLR